MKAAKAVLQKPRPFFGGTAPSLGAGEPKKVLRPCRAVRGMLRIRGPLAADTEAETKAGSNGEKKRRNMPGLYLTSKMLLHLNGNPNEDGLNSL